MALGISDIPAAALEALLKALAATSCACSKSPLLVSLWPDWASSESFWVVDLLSPKKALGRGREEQSGGEKAPGWTMPAILSAASVRVSEALSRVDFCESGVRVSSTSGVNH